MKIKAGLFKAQCLKLMDEVQRNHSTIIITKYGKPVAKLVAYEKTTYESTKTPSAFGCMKDSVQIYGDIFSTGEKWEADE